MMDVIMPQVGQDVPTAVIRAWHKHVGDPVRRGEVIAEVESDKATFDVEAEADGVLAEVLYEVDAEVEVFRPIARIRGSGEDVPAAPAEVAEHRGSAGAALPAAQPPADGRMTAAITTAAPAAVRPAASPLARRMARECGIDWRQLRGTGPGGRVIKIDVLNARGPSPAPARAAPPADLAGDGDVEVPFSPMRRRIAERLSLAVRTIPHFHVEIDADATAMQGWRREINSSLSARITVTDILVKVAATALREIPALNAHVADDRVTLKQRVNIGVATAVEDGLVVPVIPDADRLSLGEIARLNRENASAARAGRAGRLPADAAAGTFTLSSLGMHGIRRFLPIINPPQCAILGIGAIQDRIVPIDGGIGVRPMMTLVLGCDHRAIDGVAAAQFLNCLKEIVETWPSRQ